ncbi:MAG: hypothetical protein ACH255_21065 [Candidatus Thiodiazotropha sp.]
MNLDAFKKSFRGEERLFIVFWFYFVAGSVGLGLVFATISAITATLGVGYIITTILLIVIAIYFVWIIVSTWRCAFNVENRVWGYIVRVLVLLHVTSVAVGLLS